MLGENSLPKLNFLLFAGIYFLKQWQALWWKRMKWNLKLVWMKLGGLSPESSPLPTCHLPGLLKNQWACNFSVFWKCTLRQTKTMNVSKISMLNYIGKSQKDLELVFNLQNWGKNNLKMLFLSYTIIWSDFIWILPRILKGQSRV